MQIDIQAHVSHFSMTDRDRILTKYRRLDAESEKVSLTDAQVRE